MKREGNVLIFKGIIQEGKALNGTEEHFQLMNVQASR